MTPRRLAITSLLVGSLVIVAGLALIYPPAAVIAVGCGLLAVGLEELRSKA